MAAAKKRQGRYWKCGMCNGRFRDGVSILSATAAAEKICWECWRATAATFQYEKWWGTDKDLTSLSSDTPEESTEMASGAGYDQAVNGHVDAALAPETDHPDTVPCDVCGKKFSSAVPMIVHRTTKHGAAR